MVRGSLPMFVLLSLKYVEIITTEYCGFSVQTSTQALGNILPLSTMETPRDPGEQFLASKVPGRNFLWARGPRYFLARESSKSPTFLFCIFAKTPTLALSSKEVLFSSNSLSLFFPLPSSEQVVFILCLQFLNSTTQCSLVSLEQNCLLISPCNVLSTKTNLLYRLILLDISASSISFGIGRL